MKKITIIAILIILTSFSTAKNLTENELHGRYIWLGVVGQARSIELKKDGEFEYYWQTGLKGGTTKGTWRLEEQKIILNSNTRPYAILNEDFEILKTEQIQTDTLTIEVLDVYNDPIPFLECILINGDTVIERVRTNQYGLAKLNRGDAECLLVKNISFPTIKINMDNTASKYVLRMKSDWTFYQDFIDKELIYKRGRLYDMSIKKSKYVRRKYYVRVENEL